MLFSCAQFVYFYVNMSVEKTQDTMIVFRILAFLVHTSYLNSTAVTMLITINQFISVKYAIKYHKMVTNQRLYVAIFVVIVTCYLTYIIMFWFRKIIFMFAIFLTLTFIVMAILMSFIFRIAHAAIKAIITSEAPRGEEKDIIEFMPRKMKKWFIKPDNKSEEQEEKKKQMKMSQQLACVSIVTMALLCIMAAMCIQGIVTGVHYNDIKVYMIVASVYTMMNPVIYISTMSKIRFFVKKDWEVWKQNNAFRFRCIRRRRRRVNPLGIS